MKYSHKHIYIYTHKSYAISIFRQCIYIYYVYIYLGATYWWRNPIPVYRIIGCPEYCMERLQKEKRYYTVAGRECGMSRHHGGPIKGPLKPLELRGLRKALNWALMALRDVSLSGGRWKKFQEKGSPFGRVLGRQEGENPLPLPFPIGGGKTFDTFSPSKMSNNYINFYWCFFLLLKKNKFTHLMCRYYVQSGKKGIIFISKSRDTIFTSENPSECIYQYRLQEVRK